MIGIAGASELPSFVAVQVASDAATTSTPRPPASEGAWHPHEAGLIEIDLGDGRRVRVDRHVDAAALERVLTVLARR